jgi:MSHA biogenesis protein MshI
MRWPWQRRTSNDRLVVEWTAERFAYVQAERTRVLRCGVELRGDDAPQAFARRVRGLGLPGQAVSAVLPLADCQLLQIVAPAVPAAELRAAARWSIKDMVEAHLDDLTLDVMTVGDGRQTATRQLFVAAAASRNVRDTIDRAQVAGLALSVIEIRETAQRNLQSALAETRHRLDRANAALMVHDRQCLLTICAHGELFHARRLEWDPRALSGAGAGPAGGLPPLGAPAPELVELDFVDYGADADADADTAHLGDAPQLVIELQRSLDVWERSWPELPLDVLSVHAGEHSQALVRALSGALSLPVEVLDVDQVFAGFAQAAGTPEVGTAVRPLLGALLRSEARQL